MSERNKQRRERLVGLIAALEKVNTVRERGETEDHETIEALFDNPSKRLAVYGSLAPGEVNHHVIEAVRGSWQVGFVRGAVKMKGWGSHVGFPGMTWVPSSDHCVPVVLFTSAELPQHWDRLDQFEGADYVRVLVLVEGVNDAAVVANLYQIRAQPV